MTKNEKKKHRADFKKAIHHIVDIHPEVADTLKRFKRADTCRPKQEIDQPALLQTVTEIASPSAATDDRRQTELLRSITKLDDLTQELQKRGFSISRSATYLRLISRRSNTIEGKRHVSTVPVKLVCAQNTGRHPHVDSHFAAATIEYLKDLAMLFGSKSVFVTSQDDKARVPLALLAVKKQAPLLMHLQYRIELPDHVFFIAEKHKLIPSVYGIRSGKHDHSTAFTYLTDLSKCLTLDEFKQYSHTDNDEIKPIFIIFTDGAPDENPRFPKARQCYADLFIRNDELIL
ncbi:unnamed protein product, partial [Rotaria sp. Silwood1]